VLDAIRWCREDNYAYRRRRQILLVLKALICRKESFELSRLSETEKCTVLCLRPSTLRNCVRFVIAELSP
jgi:hypothetical protein